MAPTRAQWTMPERKKQKTHHVEMLWYSPRFPSSVTEIDFFRFPKEIRLLILSFTDLVVRRHPHHVVPDVRIRNGQVVCNAISPATSLVCEDYMMQKAVARKPTCRFGRGLDCPCLGTTQAILNVNHKLFHEEAMEVLLTHNRLVFEPQDPMKILHWLQAQGPLVRRIKWMDVQFTLLAREDTFTPDYYGWQKKSSATYSRWMTLVAFIEKNLQLDRLELCVDAGLDAGIINTVPYEETAAGYEDRFLECYRKMIKPLEKLGWKKGLKSFVCFLSCHHKQELLFEKRVMGQDYTPPDKGRV